MCQNLRGKKKTSMKMKERPEALIFAGDLKTQDTLRLTLVGNVILTFKKYPTCIFTILLQETENKKPAHNRK